MKKYTLIIEEKENWVVSVRGESPVEESQKFDILTIVGALHSHAQHLLNKATPTKKREGVRDD